jgi:hypothetical protein
MADQSYRMRMYKRRLWQQRWKISITGIALWTAIVATVLIVLELMP